MVDKYYNENGEVGVIVSRGYGAGWYSWNRDTQYGTDILFDKTLVEMILNKTKIEEIEKYVDTKYPDCYSGGIEDSLDVEFMPEGSHFIVEEYDGAEHIEYIENIDFITA